MSEHLKEAVQAIDKGFVEVAAGHETLGLQLVAIMGNALVALEALSKAVQELEER